MQIQRRFFGKEWLWSLVVGVICLALTIVVTWYVEKRTDLEVASEFEQISDKLVLSLQRRLNNIDIGLTGLQGLLDVTRGKGGDRDFRLYFSKQNLTDEFPGVLGFGFVRRVGAGEVDAYVAQQQRLRSVFRLQTLKNDQEDRFIIETIEPLEQNWASLGSDIAAEPGRRAAAIAAMQTGEKRLSGLSKLEQDFRGGSGLLYFMPYYRPGLPLTSVAERERALEGWIYAPIQLSRLMADLQKNGEALFDYELFIDEADSPGKIGVRVWPESEQPASLGKKDHRAHVRDVRLVVSGQTFVLRIGSQPAFEAKYSSRYGPVTFTAGLAITGLLCWALWLVGRTRRRAHRLAGEMTAAARDREAQINAVLNNTVESIITVDQKGVIRSFNRAAQELFGYTESEVCGRNAAILSPDEGIEVFDEAAIRTLMEHAKKSGATSVVEAMVRDRFGRIFPVEMSVGEFTLADETVFVGLLRDISWRRQQEEEKSAIQERLRLALDAAGFGVWQWWPDTRRFVWDANTCRLYGVDPEDYPQNYESWVRLIHRDDLDRVVHAMRSTFTRAGRISEIFRVRWPDGTIRYLIAHAIAVHDGTGQVSAIGVVQDMTIQKMTEESLRMSEERFALAARAAQEGIWDWDLRTGQIWFSPQWKAHFGFRDDELENNLATWESLILPEDHDEALSMVERFNRGETDRFEAIQRFRHKDGHTVFIRSRAVQLRNAQSEVVRIVGSHEDITEILRQENELRDSRERLALTIDCAGLGTWDWDLKTNQVSYGGKWGEMLGYSTDDVRRNLVSWQVLVHPHDLPSAMAAHEAHWRGDTPTYVSEYRMRTKSGDWRWVLGVGRVVARDTKQRPLRMLGVNIDIDERKKNEAALHDARQQAEEASRAKSEFLANISHEIRTPLNAVLGFSTLLAETPLNNRQSDFVDSIHTAGDALLTLINDLLDFSKIEAGHLDLEEIEFDTRSTLEDTLDIVAARAAAKKLNLACLIEPSVPAKLRGDPSRLRQILLNLMINAVKFTEHGDVVARARAVVEEDGRVCLRVEVQDSGIGIPADVQLKLFRPFTQADASTTRRFGGTGLGLSICRRLTEAMGGTIGVQSKSGEGALFWFEVHLHAVPEFLTLPLIPPAMQGSKILVVDPSAIGRELMALQLESMGLVADCRATFTAALNALSHSAADYVLAILCQELPEHDGIHLAEAIHAEPRWRDLPLILLTSLATPELAEEARQARVTTFLTKPVRQQQLLSSLREALQLQAPEPRMPTNIASFPRWLAEEKPVLLLAEDNPVNQKVAALMLEGLGCQVDIVGNGVAAIAALEEHAYDLILMDCQMPEMDGFTATERIRSMPGLRGGIPIVALTANVFRTDAERCFKVGMNDFVSKPFTREQLLQVLLRWLPAQRNASSIISGGSAQTRQNMAEPELPQIALQSELAHIQSTFDELSCNLGMDMRAELLALYFPTQDECLQQIGAALASEDTEQARTCAHKLKGAAAQLGAKGLAACSLGIEHACRDNDLTLARQLFNSMQELAQGLRQALSSAD